MTSLFLVHDLNGTDLGPAEQRAMLAKLFTFSMVGIDAKPVDVEVDISPAAMPRTNLVGLAEAAVKESIHRIERAMANSGYQRPNDRIVINLSPADLPKEAASFDLPIALGLLAASGQFGSDLFAQYSVVGELALDGAIRPVKGALSMALESREQGLKGIVVPVENGNEAAVVEGIDVIPVASLSEAVGFFTEELPVSPLEFNWDHAVQRFGQYTVDYSDVKGQENAKRALIVAASGTHHLLMIGSPGTGKTLLAQRIATIMPRLHPEESLETTRIWSAVGRLERGQSLIVHRPFRSPHHTISEAGLVGGGSNPAPGEISLAHNGILFLDELPEFNRRTLEVLRQPLEDHCVTISRAMGSVTFPAKLMLVSAMNPCPCGFRGDPRRNCNCSPMQIERYLGRISGPLLDRIDIHIEVPNVPFRELSDSATGTTSEQMLEQVLVAREMQHRRFEGQPAMVNGKMSPNQIRKYCKLETDAEDLLKSAMEEMGFSARAHDKILRVARTAADLANSDRIALVHISEAINYRTLDRNYWQ